MSAFQRRFAAVLVVGALGVWNPAWLSAQVATGNVAGTVKDSQGGVLPGATVSLISESRGTTIDTTTNETGDFVFPNITGDTYTVRVTMDGFRALERRGVPVSAGDRVAVGTLTMELGVLAETVVVTGEAPMIQARSGERSFTITTEAVQNLPVSNRNFAALTSLTAGITMIGNAPTRLGGGGQNNFQIDGVTIMDTGSNGQMLQTNVEAIAEVKVVTQGYSAEYGRNSGLQISGITKSGTNQVRGSLYDIERNSDWNSNSWQNVRNGDPKPVSKDRDWGYTLGGPVGKPGGTNKLFFFYAHEYRPRTTGGGNPSRFRVPTELERAGDFSQTRDNNGALFNLIRDASTGLPCSAADTRGCFQDGGVLGRIPANRLYQNGVNILKLWPTPNTAGVGYNFEVTPPIDKRLTQQPTVRLDYQPSSRLRITGKYTGQRATVKVTPGSIPGFNDTLQKFPFVTSYSTTVDYTLSDSMFLEGTWGFIRNQLGSPIITDKANRCNVGLCDIPFLYPNFGVMDPDTYQYRLMNAIGAPYFVDGQLMLMPQYSWGSRIANAPPNLSYPSFTNINRTNDVSISATKVHGGHTFKAGFFFGHSYKAQNLGQQAGAIPFQGMINFANDTNNPLDTGFGFANAALGVFSSYGQQSNIIEGGFIYNTIEWYVQDNWKVNERLTLDYGMRFTHQQPQHDKFLQSSNFFTDRWEPGSAPALYVPACPTGVTPCASGSRQAKNPVTGALLGPGSAALIGTIVPTTGNKLNGLVRNGDGIAKTNYTWPAIAIAPRFGAAYDVSGTNRFIVRGSAGLFFDRPDGDTVFPQIGNPPSSEGTTVRYATLQSIGRAGLASSAPAILNIHQYDAKIPSSTQWNAGIQAQLPWAAALDVSYVGNHGFNLMQNRQGRVGVLDLNAVDFGAAYLPRNQDLTLPASTVPGGTALTQDLLRPYQGYAQINAFLTRFRSTYHSIQTSLNRRFRNGVQFSVNYTYGISFTGTAGMATTTTVGDPGIGLRLQHAPDGSYSLRDDQAEFEELMKDMGNQPHTLRANAIWDMPDFHGNSSGGKALGLVLNGWQLSGVLTAGSGIPYDATFQYNANGFPINLTGSPSYNGRIIVTGDPGSGCSGDEYAQFNTRAFAGPSYGSLGLESGRNILRGCADRTVDLAIARNFPFGGGKNAQIRLDVFNAFNTVIYNSRVTQLQMNSPTDQTIRNAQFSADGTLNQARLQPKNAGFGAANGAQPMRTIWLQLRMQF